MNTCSVFQWAHDIYCTSMSPNFKGLIRRSVFHMGSSKSQPVLYPIPTYLYLRPAWTNSQSLRIGTIRECYLFWVYRAYPALPVFLVIGWGNWNVLLVARSEISFSIPINLTRSYQVWASVLSGLSPHDLSIPRSTLEWLRYLSEQEYLHCLDAEPFFFTCPAGREGQRLDKRIWWLKIQCPKKFASPIVLFPKETERPHYMGR